MTASQESYYGEYYIHKATASPIVLYRTDGDTLIFVNTSTLNFHHFTDKEFKRLLARNKVEKANYLLAYVFSPSSSPLRVNGRVISTKIEDIISKLKDIQVQTPMAETVFGNQSLIFKDCAVYDLRKHEPILIASSLKELGKKLHQLEQERPNSQQQGFKPSPINIKALLQHTVTPPDQPGVAAKKNKSR